MEQSILDYYHSKKAGNIGDVWKHLILCEVVQALLDTSVSETFTYVETHCAYPHYAFDHTGEWVYGIGRCFMLSQHLLSRPYFQLNNPATMNDYVKKIEVNEVPEPPYIYLGSAALTLQMAMNAGRAYAAGFMTIILTLSAR